MLTFSGPQDGNQKKRRGTDMSDARTVILLAFVAWAELMWVIWMAI